MALAGYTPRLQGSLMPNLHVNIVHQTYRYSSCFVLGNARQSCFTTVCTTSSWLQNSQTVQALHVILTKENWNFFTFDPPVHSILLVQESFPFDTFKDDRKTSIQFMDALERWNESLSVDLNLSLSLDEWLL